MKHCNLDWWDTAWGMAIIVALFVVVIIGCCLGCCAYVDHYNRGWYVNSCVDAGKTRAQCTYEYQQLDAAKPAYQTK